MKGSHMSLIVVQGEFKRSLRQQTGSNRNKRGLCNHTRIAETFSLGASLVATECWHQKRQLTLEDGLSSIPQGFTNVFLFQVRIRFSMVMDEYP